MLEFSTDASFSTNFYVAITLPEPIGSVAPKVNAGDDLKSVKTGTDQAVTLLCPAQAYPMPVFRSVVRSNMQRRLTEVFPITLSFVTISLKLSRRSLLSLVN